LIVGRSSLGVDNGTLRSGAVVVLLAFDGCGRCVGEFVEPVPVMMVLSSDRDGDVVAMVSIVVEGWRPTAGDDGVPVSEEVGSVASKRDILWCWLVAAQSSLTPWYDGRWWWLLPELSSAL
jgi:hypothetical protein